MSPQDEIAVLVKEQETDARLGDQVHGPSINNDVWDDDDGLIVYDNGTYIFERPPYRHRRQAGILGWKARRRKTQHHARRVCAFCGAWCDQRVERCQACYLTQVASDHGTLRRYQHGCRCDDCRGARATYAKQRAERLGGWRVKVAAA